MYKELCADAKNSIAKGKKQVMRKITEGKISIVYIASDNDAHFKNELIKKCEHTGTEYRICSNKEELGRLCRIEVPCGVVGIEKADS